MYYANLDSTNSSRLKERICVSSCPSAYKFTVGGTLDGCLPSKYPYHSCVLNFTNMALVQYTSTACKILLILDLNKICIPSASSTSTSAATTSAGTSITFDYSQYPNLSSAFGVV